MDHESIRQRRLAGLLDSLHASHEKALRALSAELAAEPDACARLRAAASRGYLWFNGAAGLFLGVLTDSVLPGGCSIPITKDDIEVIPFSGIFRDSFSAVSTLILRPKAPH